MAIEIDMAEAKAIDKTPKAKFVFTAVDGTVGDLANFVENISTKAEVEEIEASGLTIREMIDKVAESGKGTEIVLNPLRRLTTLLCLVDEKGAIYTINLRPDVKAKREAEKKAKAEAIAKAKASK